MALTFSFSNKFLRSEQQMQLEEYLQSGLSRFWKQLHQDNIKQLAHLWCAELSNLNLNASQSTQDENDMEIQILQSGFQLLGNLLEDTQKRISDLRNRHRIFLTEISQENLSENKHQLILEFCRYLGGSKLHADKRALKRWLDESAASERWQSRVKDQEFYAAFLMKRLAALFDLMAFASRVASPINLWRELDVEARLDSWIRYGFEVKVQLAAFQSISSMLKTAHAEDSHLLSSELLRYTYRFALDNKQDAELQVEALHLLAVADINKANSLIEKRLERDDGPEQIFFREAVSEVICLHHLNKPDITDLSLRLIEDPSALVRQSVVQTLAVIEDDEQIALIVSKLAQDPSDAVFCQLATQLPWLLHWQGMQDFYLHALANNQSYIRLRALCSGLLSWIASLGNKHQGLNQIVAQCETVLLTLSQHHNSPQVQYLAMETREKIWATGQTELTTQLTPVLQQHGVEKLKLNTTQAKLMASDAGKRWLAANIGQQFSMQLQKNSVLKSNHIGFRFWRLIYEFLHPATDKRQHHSHITGRLYEGRDFIPSAQMAEVSQTAVPGEPLHMADEGHWRPFLPLVDQCISACDSWFNNTPVTLHHVCGQTEIVPPKSWLGKLKAKLLLSWRFEHFATLRNRAYNSDKSGDYIAALRALGFAISQNSHPLISDPQQETPVIPAVSRFFELAIPLSVVQFYQDFQRYFVSVYQNTINHILLFTIAMVAVFWGSHIAVSRRFKEARKEIPMTIGGWGTRGKSGTERLKAALINALGLSTFSKTTGCEAMFLYATRYGALKEMFLFRPYDKATIWEQTFVVRLAAKLKSDVLCWECMGLTPRYIDILQQQWMQDDFITITNCFPDHEDLQGPAGIDVPQVIAKFIAPKSQVWTSEDNMLAYLQKEAAVKQANLTHVNWLDITTIADDLLQRFPYEEHPANIALVAKMASEMQVSRTMAIKEMADRVVPDIGVLQVFPYSKVNNRSMRFINGMSANERYGALANWQRLGYDNPEKLHSGEVLLVTAINNRADRVPRSKVFARLIAYDFSAMRHFVIGDNLSGFKTFALEAWQERLAGEFTAEMSCIEFNQQYRKLLQFLLVAESEAELLCRFNCTGFAVENLEGLKQLLNSSKKEPLDEQSREFWQKQISLFEACQTGFVAEDCDSQTFQAQLQHAKTLLIQVFNDKLYLVEDFYISGEQLNQLMAHQLPQGASIDILGLQNIKGPGLDLVYSWQQWHRIHQLLSLIKTSYGEEIDGILAELAAFSQFSCLDKNAMIDFVQNINEQGGLHSETGLMQLDTLKANLTASERNQSVTFSGPSRWKPLLNAIEQSLDIFDAVFRGGKAKRILVDLANQRISLNKAAFLLKQINKRQKGGWLSQG